MTAGSDGQPYAGWPFGPEMWAAVQERARQAGGMVISVPGNPGNVQQAVADLRASGARPCCQPGAHDWSSYGQAVPKYCAEPAHWQDGPARHAGADKDVLLYAARPADLADARAVVEVRARQADVAGLAKTEAVAAVREADLADKAARDALAAAQLIVAELQEIPPPAEHARPLLAEVRSFVADLAEHWGSWRGNQIADPAARRRAQVVADVLGDVLAFMDGPGE